MNEVVHTPTLELAEKVVKVAKENGVKEPFFESEHYFKIEKEKLCFRFNDVSFSYANKDFYERGGYVVITAEEFLQRHEEPTLTFPRLMEVSDDNVNWCRKVVFCYYGAVGKYIAYDSNDFKELLWDIRDNVPINTFSWRYAKEINVK